MSRRGRRRTRGWLAWRGVLVLLIGSAVGLLLPPAITGRLNNLVQVLVPFQDGLNRVADAGGRVLHGHGDSAKTTAADAWRSMAETLAAENRRLRRDLVTLTRVRDRGLGSDGRLIPARVVADDAAYWRASKLILGGLRRGIAVHQGVISRHFSVDLSEGDGAREGMAVLAAEVLIGVVETAGTYTSRVKLLSDPDTRMPVTIGRLVGNALVGVDAAFWLEGKGSGVIEVREVHHQYVADGAIAVGDVVLTRPDEARLPPSVTIGRIAAIESDPDNGLLYVLRVDPGIDIDDVRRVYVVDIGG